MFTRTALAACVAAVAYVGGPSALSAQAPPTGVVLVAGTRVSVTFALREVRDLPAERRRMAERVNGCRVALDFAAADSAALLGRVLEPLSPANDILQITITPRPELPVDCGDQHPAMGLLESQALWVALDDSVTAARRISSVRLSHAGANIDPVSLERVVVQSLGVSGVRDAEAFAIRVAVRLEDLLPTRDAPDADLQIMVQSEAAGVSEVFDVPWPVLRELWDLTSAQRARGIASQRSSIQLDQPRDQGLRQAASAFATGDAPQAARLAAARLRSGALSDADATWARALNTLLLAEGGDVAGARLNADYLLQLEPCFGFNPAASAAARAVVDQASRPRRRCEGVSLGRVALRALVAPGFGRPGTGTERFGSGVFIAGMVLGGAARSQLLRMDARESYQNYLEYQMNTPIDPEEPMYLVPEGYIADARRAREDGIQAATFGAAVYALQFGYALWMEYRWAKRVESVSNFGRPASASGQGSSLSIEPAPSGMGVSLRWHW